MAIKSVHIKNYKSIKDTGEFNLEKLNILIGPNGSGKTNFITFFKLIRKIYEQNLQIYIAQNGGANKFLYGGSKHSDFLYGKLTFDNEWHNQYEFKLIPTTDNNFIFEEEYSNLKRNAYNKLKINNGGERESKLKDDKNFRTKYLMEHIDALKIFHFHDTSFTSKMRLPSLLSDNRYMQEDASNLPCILYKIKERHSENYNKIIFTIKTTLPYFHDFYLVPEDNQIALKWKIKNEDVIFDAHQLSDGSLRFIALTTLLMQADLPKIIIIDEPELGLHPFAINQLAQMLHIASEKTQIILSTQSSDLINAIVANAHEPEKIIESIIITEYKDDQTILKRLKYEELEHWLKSYSLKELWDKNILGGRP